MLRSVRTYRRWLAGQTVVVPYGCYVAFHLPHMLVWLICLAFLVGATFFQFRLLTVELPSSTFIDFGAGTTFIALPLAGGLAVLSVVLHDVVRVANPINRWALVSLVLTIALTIPAVVLDLATWSEMSARGFIPCSDVLSESDPGAYGYGVSSAACVEGQLPADGG